MSDLGMLRKAVLAFDGLVFAVFDGAQFQNLPDTLRRTQVDARCLYLDRGDNHPERLVTAPYMTGPLDDNHLGRTLVALGEASPAAAVFWECESGETKLYRHLRGINRILVPAVAPEDFGALLASFNGASGSASAAQPTAEQTFPLFRHADANVMAQMKLGLEPPTLARLLGPSRRLVCLASEEWGGLQLLDNPTLGVPSRGGAFGLSARETLALQETRLLQFDARLADALASERPDLRFGASSNFASRLRASRRRAVYLHGAVTERHILDLVELELVRGDAIAKDGEFRRIMDRPGWSMERRCRQLRRRFLDEREVGQHEQS